MEGLWTMNKDGFIYVFAIDNNESFENITKKIKLHLNAEKMNGKGKSLK
jgi:hypothetical protein